MNAIDYQKTEFRVNNGTWEKINIPIPINSIVKNITVRMKDGQDGQTQASLYISRDDEASNIEVYQMLDEGMLGNRYIFFKDSKNRYIYDTLKYTKDIVCQKSGLNICVEILNHIGSAKDFEIFYVVENFEQYKEQKEVKQIKEKPKKVNKPLWRRLF